MEMNCKCVSHMYFIQVEIIFDLNFSNIDEKFKVWPFFYLLFYVFVGPRDSNYAIF